MPRLRIYGILRGDLNLKPGHAAAKLMQAALVSFSKSPHELQAGYLSDGEGTQVTLVAADEVALRRAHIAAVELGIPCCVVLEDNRPVAIGVGPVMREIAEPITKGLNCMK